MSKNPNPESVLPQLSISEYRQRKQLTWTENSTGGVGGNDDAPSPRRRSRSSSSSSSLSTDDDAVGAIDVPLGTPPLPLPGLAAGSARPGVYLLPAALEGF